MSNKDGYNFLDMFFMGKVKFRLAEKWVTEELF